MSQQPNIPALRFPGFEGEWEKRKLGEMIEFKAGYAFKSEKMLSKKSKYQILKMSNVYQNELHLDRNPSYWPSINDKEKEYLIRCGDTLLTLTGTVGKRDFGYSVSIQDSDRFLLNQRLVLLREKDNTTINSFITRVVLNEKFLFHFFEEAKGGTGNQSNVSVDDVKNIDFYFPSPPEQQKIASFFTAIDKKIAQLKQQKEKLELYKKGVMQQLFSQQLRFKTDDGKDFPDWERKKLGEVAIINPKSDSLPVSFIYIDLESVESGILLKEERIEKKVAPSRAQRLLKNNDILFQMVRPYQRNNFYFNLKGDYVASTGYAQIRTQENSRYLFQYLHNQKFLDMVMERCTGTSFPAINSTDLGGITIDLPSLEEQTKIASFLSTLDEKINKVQQQLQQTGQWKKGLLQKMFV